MTRPRIEVSGQNVQNHFYHLYRCSDESGHLLESVGSAGDWSPAGVALVASPGVGGDPLTVAVVTDDVALHGDLIYVRNYQRYLVPT